MENKTLIENGVHYLSGIGSMTFDDSWNDNEIDVDLFCIDGITYGAFIDPSDGWRSYGVLMEVNAKCQTTFEPQKIITEWVSEYEEEDGWTCRNADFLIIKDAILNKEVLRVGTDRTDDYYPMAIFDFQPMNLYENVKRSIELAR